MAFLHLNPKGVEGEAAARRALGLSPFEVGIITTATLLGSGALTLLVGLFCLAAGALRLGFVAGSGLLFVGMLFVAAALADDELRESIEKNLDFARQYVDWPYIQHPTPYPGTPMTEDFRARGLIVNERVAEYDGTTAVVKSKYVEAEEIEFLRAHAPGDAVASGRGATDDRARRRAAVGPERRHRTGRLAAPRSR